MSIKYLNNFFTTKLMFIYILGLYRLPEQYVFVNEQHVFITLLLNSNLQYNLWRGFAWYVFTYFHDICTWIVGLTFGSNSGAV